MTKRTGFKLFKQFKAFNEKDLKISRKDAKHVLSNVEGAAKFSKINLFAFYVFFAVKFRFLRV